MSSSTKSRPPNLPLISGAPSNFLRSTTTDPSHPRQASEERLSTTTLDLGALQPGFEYNASLHVLDAAPPQTHPTIAPPQPQTPLSAGLRLRTKSLSATLPESSAIPVPLNEETLQQASISTGLPVRSSSLRSALSAARQNIGSLSPGSAYSSPGLGPLVDITPLPSPLAATSGLWRRSLEDTTSAESFPITSTSVSMASPSEPALIPRISPKKRRFPTNLASPGSGTYGIDSQIRAINSISHARNRSNSEYVPESMQVSRPRNIVVSGSTVPLSLQPHSPPIEHLHREEYLAVQRGITVPIAKPPTPPKSNRGTDNSDQESPPTSPLATKDPLPLQYEAQMIRSGKINHWRAIRQLGQGTFSTVMLATSQEANGDIQLSLDNVMCQVATPEEQRLEAKSLVAVKICERGPTGGADEKKIEVSLKRELDILKSINHPSLVHLKAVNIMSRRALLVLNYCAGGDLFDLAVTKPDLLVPGLIRRIFAELVAAVQYLHLQYIVHRDIKLENILVNLPTSTLITINDWQKYPYPVVTLTDLGLGRWVPKPPESPLLDTKCGSEDYAAPELLMGQEYDGRATDAWALGVTLYAVMEGRLPFDPIPGARRKSPPKHRIARCEWSWVRYADDDGEWDPVKGQALEGGRIVVEGLLARLRSRWSLQKVQESNWVANAITVEGGLSRVDDDAKA
ncbi:MAG: hypothetical protein Q9195_001262 [Heterodermia aff. obscurata]